MSAGTALQQDSYPLLKEGNINKDNISPLGELHNGINVFSSV